MWQLSNLIDKNFDFNRLFGKKYFNVYKLEPHSDISAVGGEVHLDDKAGDALTVATPVEGGARGQVIEVHTVLLRAHCKVLFVRAESTVQKKQKNNVNFSSANQFFCTSFCTCNFKNKTYNYIVLSQNYFINQLLLATA